MAHRPPFAHQFPALNIGNGSWKFDHWINMDVVAEWPGYEATDVVADARHPLPFKDEHFETVYLGHLLQHLPQRSHRDCMEECRRVLKPNSLLVITEVDMDVVMHVFLGKTHTGQPGYPHELTRTTAEEVEVGELIWGEQGRVHGAGLEESDTHRWGFTEKTLRQELEMADFPNAERIKIHHEDVWYELTLKARKV